MKEIKDFSRRGRSRQLVLFTCAIVSGVQAFTGSAFATTQSASRAQALAWMIQQQKGDGSWVDVGQNFQSVPTAIALDSLSSSGIRYGYISGAASSWLLNHSADSVEGLSRQITALAKAGIDTTAQVDRLLKSRTKGRAGANVWGTYADWSPGMPETALALEALMMAGHPSAAGLQAQIGSLQRADGGWAYGAHSNSKSAILPTAEAVRVLASYAVRNPASKSAADTAVNSGVNWLLARRKTDGGFADDASAAGTFNASKPAQALETARVWIALRLASSAGYTAAQSTLATAALDSSQAWLLANQQPSGAWNGDPLTTAVVLHAWGTAGGQSSSLADVDRDGVPDIAEPALGLSSSVAADARALPPGNRNGMAAAGPGPEGDVPIPVWGLGLLGGALLTTAWSRGRRPR